MVAPEVQQINQSKKHFQDQNERGKTNDNKRHHILEIKTKISNKKTEKVGSMGLH